MKWNGNSGGQILSTYGHLECPNCVISKHLLISDGDLEWPKALVACFWPVLLTLDLIAFLDVGHHHNGRRLLLPHQPPEVNNSLWEGPCWETLRVTTSTTQNYLIWIYMCKYLEWQWISLEPSSPGGFINTILTRFTSCWSCMAMFTYCERNTTGIASSLRYVLQADLIASAPLPCVKWL